MPDNTLPKPVTPSTSTTPVVTGTPMPATKSTPVSPTAPGVAPVVPPVSSGLKVTTTPPVTTAPTTSTPPSANPTWMSSPAKPVTPVTPVSSPTPSMGATPASSSFASAPKPSSAPGPATMAPAPKKSALRFLPLLLLLVLLLGGIGGAVYWYFNIRNGGSNTGNLQGATSKKTIVYWGLWEPSNVLDQVFRDFEQQNPSYKVEYIQQSHKDYRERLQAEIAKGSGPDIMRYHASWVPMLKNELSPLPEKIMTSSEFSETFYPDAVKQLTLNNTIVGIPLMTEGLGLYYNKDIFSVANMTPPKNWEEMKKTASDLTIRDGSKITRGGAAMGTASNVEHFSEIIALLMLQNGADPADPTSPQAKEALNFYFDFANKLGVWDTTLPAATVAFAKGDVAMMIAPSWRAHEIKAANPNLQFDVVPVPQLQDKERITWSSFWAEGVSAQSKEKEGAWLLLKYLSSAEVQKKFYSDASTVRAFGELYSRKDLGNEIADKPYVGAYIQDAPYAKSWYLNGYTHDNGINDRIIKYYEDAINAGPGSLDESVQTIKQGMTQVLTQYGVSVQQPAVAPQQ